MIRIRTAAERGRFTNHWLDARFSFSFGNWRDPAYDGYGDLQVLNDDRVAPGGGFAEHGHRDVEVMSYPLAGAIEHRDSLGNVALMGPGDVHLMRAGSGIRHSEMNASATESEHHLQWWIAPAQTGLPPAYARIHVPAAETLNRLRLIGSPDGADGSLAVAQDVRVFAAVLDGGAIRYTPPRGRRTYVHVARGTLRLDEHALAEGDDVFIDAEPAITLIADADQAGEVLLFDLRGAAAA